MARHDPSSMSEDDLLSVAEPIATEPTESITHTDRFHEHLRTSERLNEYYNQVVAELRASLERIEEGDQASRDEQKAPH
jgi:hypothetical protein